MYKQGYDAIVVGAGPNGLAAAITLQEAGLSVMLVEAKPTIGGGMRSAELTLPGFVHDICSAVHPTAVLSPFFKKLPLKDFGVEMIQPEFAAAHPFDDGKAAVLHQSVMGTAEGLGIDKKAYLDFMQPLVAELPGLLPDLLGPLKWPKHPIDLAMFGFKALPPATWTRKLFKTKEARGLWAGMAAHAIQPLQNIATSAFGIMLMAGAHLAGWPIPKGGSQSIADALAGYFLSIGGQIQTGFEVKSLDELPDAKAILLDITPRQLLKIAGNRLSPSYRKRLEKYRHGMGVFKIDWALHEPIPFTADACRKAGTVHLGNTFEEIAHGEKSMDRGKHVDKPFVLLAQQSLFDPGRVPAGKQAAWAYCHVPNGSDKDMTTIIEDQVERFAPGFRDTIIEKHTMNTAQMEAYNPNYIGGDINGGVQDILQLYSRPTLQVSPYRTSAEGVYLCSSSTPPGGGVHGMCGHHAAIQALKDVFKIDDITTERVK
ncbi:phytoene desaturase family protein [Dyadobacter chenhuakuii]|uniref:NAD(P)/FAD-dependent oxidoreductase n=1 Tax=Dyadobacter chenhuakuii TaxID=2909339 RepID=A0ABY4XKC6_9BACT|nr:NAD(P)/FAD-dependent oxidoreductase [Dyadobacter chenhuakuii]MCF2496378.1 NAD(P)/FAD-dependent oxidoreductase [Dyadobacter chenhuakuii]USJ30437.1 NAD(P)/FAD-dependent oxidoreductase [Dyadobacter chenhuakuii]